MLLSVGVQKGYESQADHVIEVMNPLLHAMLEFRMTLYLRQEILPQDCLTSELMALGTIIPSSDIKFQTILYSDFANAKSIEYLACMRSMRPTFFQCK